MRKFVRFLFVLFAIGLAYMIWLVISLFRAPDMSKVPAYYPFKSAKKMELYLNYYDTRAKQWPVASEAKYIQTSYGKTFVRISGPADAPVLALLPSASASSLIWIPNIKTLSQSFRVYAIDNISDFGRSINSRVIKNSDDIAGWLDELFTAMGLVDKYYLRARQENDAFTFESISRAQEYLTKALELEGDNPLLAFGMAESYLNLSYLDIQKSSENIIKADDYLARALAKDPALPEAHALTGIIESQIKGNQREAIRHFRIALAANPVEPIALCYLAKTYLMFIGRISASIPLHEKLKEVDPQNWGNKTIPGDMEFYSGRYDKAVDSWGAAFRANPQDPAYSYAYSLALIYAGRQEEAFSLINKNATLTPDYYLTVASVLLKAALQGDRQKVATIMISDFSSVCRRDCGISHIAAAAMAQLGEKRQALDWLQNAVDRGFWNYPFLEKDPLLKNLRDESRFKAILEQARKEWESVED